MNSKGLLKLKYDSRDFSHEEKFGTLGAAQFPANDFTVYDSFQYVVKRGDTLSALSVRFGCAVNDLVSFNHIKNPNVIYAGQMITIPARTIKILNQLDLDFCTSFTTAELQSLIFGGEFDPLWQMAKIKQLIGSYNGFGASLRDAARSVVKFGSLSNKIAPYTHDGSPSDRSRDFLANWANYPISLDKNALKYRDLSYFNVDGPYDIFDDIRSALHLHRTERQAVTFGLNWHFEWTHAPGGVIPEGMPTSQGEGHNMAIIGQRNINGKMYLVFQQTWGDTAGDNGLYYFPRSIVDQAYLQGYGAFIFSRLDGSGMTSSSFLGSLLAMLKSLIK